MLWRSDKNLETLEMGSGQGHLSSESFRGEWRQDDLNMFTSPKADADETFEPNF